MRLVSISRFVAHQANDDAFAAVDLLVDKLEEQLRRPQGAPSQSQTPAPGQTQEPIEA